MGCALLKRSVVFVFKSGAPRKTQRFFEKHGGKTIVLARFVPIVRTFAPFVAGVGTMKYRNFVVFNIVGAFLWTSLFIFSGYFIGNIPVVKENFEIVIMVIIFISVLPMVVKYITRVGKVNLWNR